MYVVLCLIVFGCQYQCNWLPGKTRLRNDLLCVEWNVKPYTLTQSLAVSLICLAEAHNRTNQWIAYFTSTENRHALPLFTSLLNIVCAYDPVGFGMPYNHLMFTDSREPLVEVALHVLCATLEASEPAVPPSEVIAGTASVKPANEVTNTLYCVQLTPSFTSPKWTTATVHELSNASSFRRQSCVWLSLVVSTSAIDCLKRLVSEMTYYVSSGTLNTTHSLTHTSSVSLHCLVKCQVY